MPAITIAVINNQRGDSAGTSGARTTALAPQAPMMNCPSAPMFHNFMRNAIEQASAVRMIGVALTIVSDSTPISPNEARAMCAYDRNGLPPTNAMSNPPRINATTMAPSETAAECQAGGTSSRGSSLMRQDVRFFDKADSVMLCLSLFLDLIQRCTRHHQTNRLNLTLVWFGRFDLYLSHDFSFIDHIDPVAQRQ